jgi:dipeptidase
MSCTSIMVGKKASSDGSVLCSHTADCHRSGSAILYVPATEHAPLAQRTLTKRREDNTGLMERWAYDPTGTIPQPPRTFAYLNPVYACMNEKQLAIGESTCGGRAELMSKKGLIDCETLIRLMLERTSTAREAIRLGGELLAQHGWCDEGEALTIADTQEVWMMEIIGPGEDKIGAAWAAQRVPDDHVSVVANSFRIGELDLADSEFFMASTNVLDLAREKGYWDPNGKTPFRFYDAYNPAGRCEVASTRREWRVLDLLAPGLGLRANANVFPFSVKPESPVTVEKIMALFRDTYEGTDYDVTRQLVVQDDHGKYGVSPMANPFMPYDMNRMLRLNGAWSYMFERQLARWYCMYATVTQSRAHLPDAVGGVTWFGYANPATTTYAPLYAGVLDVPEDYKVDGRQTGFSRRSAFWAFRRVATIAGHRWGEMRKDVGSVRDPLQEKFLSNQKTIQEEAVKLLETDPAKARAYLTEESKKACLEATEAYWNLGDLLWSKYDEKW